jgi:hypothetical protein
MSLLRSICFFTLFIFGPLSSEVFGSCGGSDDLRKVFKNSSLMPADPVGSFNPEKHFKLSEGAFDTGDFRGSMMKVIGAAASGKAGADGLGLGFPNLMTVLKKVSLTPTEMKLKNLKFYEKILETSKAFLEEALSFQDDLIEISRYFAKYRSNQHNSEVKSFIARLYSKNPEFRKLVVRRNMIPQSSQTNYLSDYQVELLVELFFSLRGKDSKEKTLNLIKEYIVYLQNFVASLDGSILAVRDQDQDFSTLKSKFSYLDFLNLSLGFEQLGTLWPGAAISEAQTNSQFSFHTGPMAAVVMAAKTGKYENHPFQEGLSDVWVVPFPVFQSPIKRTDSSKLSPWGKTYEPDLTELAGYFLAETATSVATYVFTRPGSPYSDFNFPRAFPFVLIGGPSRVDNFADRIGIRSHILVTKSEKNHSDYRGVFLDLNRQLELLLKFRSPEVEHKIFEILYENLKDQAAGLENLDLKAFGELYSVVQAFDTVGAKFDERVEWGKFTSYLDNGRVDFSYKKEGLFDDYAKNWFLKLASGQFFPNETEGTLPGAIWKIENTPFFIENVLDPTKTFFHSYVRNVVYPGKRFIEVDAYWERLEATLPAFYIFLQKRHGKNLKGGAKGLEEILNRLIAARARVAIEILEQEGLWRN